jgi:small redox-active disulfide protein 2
VEKAIKDLGTCAEIEKVQDLKAIMDFGVMVTPALAIDGNVKVAGKIPSVEDIKKLVEEAQ